jgi:hypothetical protein
MHVNATIFKVMVAQICNFLTLELRQPIGRKDYIYSSAWVMQQNVQELSILLNFFGWKPI